MNQADTPWEKVEVGSFEECEDCFRAIMRKPLSQAEKIEEADIVVGVPFYNEADTIGPVLETVRKGLEKFYPEQKCVIVAAGSPAGGKALKVIKALPKSARISRIAFLLNDEKVNGKGWAVRAIMEIARTLGADLAIVEADLESRTRDGGTEGLAPDWINLLLEPVREEEVDLVISRFNRHYFESPISAHLVYPLLTAIYNRPIHDLIGAQWGISHRLLRTYLQDYHYPWSNETNGYGIDSWLATTAITSGARIGEANLGVKIPGPSGKTELILRQIARVLFEHIVADKEWEEKMATGTSLVLQPLAIFGIKKAHQPDEVRVTPQQLVTKYKQGFNRFDSLYKRILPSQVYQQLETLARTETKDFDFPAHLWAQIVYHFLLDLASRKEFARGDLMNSFIPLYEGYVAGFTLKIKNLKAKLGRLPPDEAEHLASLEAEERIEALVNEFLRQRPDFLEAWEVREEAFEPPVPKVTYREFIPGVPLVVPLEITTPEGNLVTANAVYESVFHRYQNEFEQFVYERLKVPRDASSQEIAERISDFMHQVEEQIDKVLLPGDLSSVEGVREVVEAIFRHFPHQDTFALIPEMASWLLRQSPPYNLLTKLGHGSLIELLEKYEPNDVLALASWSEEREYFDLTWTLIKDSIRPEHFKLGALKPMVVSYEEFPSLMEMKESAAALDKISGRVVVSNLHKGMGGEFPKLRYFTTIAKSIIEAERFGKIWQKFAEGRKDFNEKVINSLEGHWGKDPLSAHNIFEDGHQRVLVERLREMAQRLHQESGEDKARLVTLLNNMIDSYHLALTLPDGTFIPCSAWTWASYSFKGGAGLPTPLSLHVERDWSSREFLTEYFRAVGGEEEVIERKIVELMEQGREWEDLSPILLGRVGETEAVISRHIAAPAQPRAGELVRFAGNPILEPVREHPWESKYVFNPGAINLGGKVYLVYRAVGEDNISRLGLAVSEDGFKFSQRLEKPIFEPKGKSEEKGCEDPRLTLIGDRIYMLYTAYGSLVAQIALASISVNDFLNYHWGAWRRHGLVFPGFTDKNGTLFPERFEERFAMLHRVEPHIWITLSPHLRCPWPRREHKILAGSRPGIVWDGEKIGAGAQPIKTKYGWLLTYHGVDHARIYRLGVMLLDLSDPTVLIYRSPNFILEPKESYEVGEVGKHWVPNVVFTCGAVPREANKETLDGKDEILVYYGAADSVVGVATAKIATLIPEKFT